VEQTWAISGMIGRLRRSRADVAWGHLRTLLPCVAGTVGLPREGSLQQYTSPSRPPV